jgi:hypothetical protein
MLMKKKKLFEQNYLIEISISENTTGYSRLIRIRVMLWMNIDQIKTQILYHQYQ